jgi:hypothetical protein
MTRLNLLYITEHNPNDDKTTDNRIIIVYDNSELEHGYYCYGTRRKAKNSNSEDQKYNDYKLFFGSNQINKLIDMVSFLNNNFHNKVTIEMHQIDLYEEEYEYLDFENIFWKLSHNTELYAYDKITESRETIKRQLRILKSSTSF